MRLLSVLAPLALASFALAYPKGPWEKCLCQEEADKLVSEYIAILTHTSSDLGDANATAQVIIADDYDEISDSILSLEGMPLGGIAFAGKQAYIAGVLGAPAVPSFITLDILVSCPDRILWQWIVPNLGSKQYEVKGFNLFNVTDAGQLSLSYIEFNSIAWGLDTGYKLLFPGQSKN